MGLLSKKLLLLGGLLVFGCASQAQDADDKLEIIIDGVDKTLPIAVLPFGWNGAPDAQPIDIHVTIANDLERSGRFSTMDSDDMPQQPNNFNHINFKDWQLLQMENMVIGNLVHTADGNFEVEFRLLDVYKGTQLAGFRIPATRKQLRRTAHRISDIIFEKLTGIRGAFDTRIAYVTVKEAATGEKSFSLKIADADGFNEKTLLKSNEPLMSPAWSPSGSVLAYVSFEGRSSSIFLQDIRSGKREQIAAFDGINSAPSWSPDGSRMAMTLSRDGNPEIYILDLSTRALRRLTHNRAIDTEPNWSPDGNKLVFTSDRGGSPQIYAIDAGGGNVKRLTFDGPYFARPRYAPDGKSLTMVAGKDKHYRIAWLDLENSYMTLLTQNRSDESPSFSPNGSMIIYSTTADNGSELAAVSADGEVHQRLAIQDGEVREPAWGPFPKQ